MKKGEAWEEENEAAEDIVEDGSDLQFGKYDVEVMNGQGYYDRDGKYIPYHFVD